MAALAVILTTFIIALVVDRVTLSERVHKLEMKLRNEHYKE
ncbi:hypothetical protein [Limosilactobacillus fermentum]|nr:hypothetical protein [Limosilactobacillus fermentum]